MILVGLILICVGRWNSWNFFACDINETVIKETGIIVFLFSAIDIEFKKFWVLVIEEWIY